MRIPRHWRLNAQRYALQGVTCSHCTANIFPPREVCPYCEARTEEKAYDFDAAQAQPNGLSLILEPAAR